MLDRELSFKGNCVSGVVKGTQRIFWWQISLIQAVHLQNNGPQIFHANKN